MGLPRMKHPGYTLEDWRSWDGRWELIDGVAYDLTPSPGAEHQRISSDLHTAIALALLEVRNPRRTPPCQLFHAPTDVYLGPDVVLPDLLLVCDPAKISSRGIEGAPDLVVEILSPATAGKDFTRKWWIYEAAGVPEYLIVDPGERIGRLLRLKSGRYQDAARVEWGALAPLLGGRLGVSAESLFSKQT